ncbi:aminopeptidase N-like [Drosophila eugracilis]|uniref:aminopeptidase N-like n=1 Tax=Drosophila eugracilis TaxID=29029 RepID=UPI001BDA8880|nr:aminopeptidase N-like [Drosophila eugracilis]XP_017083306.2 aminopeptidase N-like [Drosophila eugracilis]XP_017083307.2 aminopeptidase N-like [Drosophila eugracilis]XP_041675290.1 aminopeptidase N-like [Drosophila eugracilis]
MKCFLLFVLAIGLGLSAANSVTSYNYYRLPTALRPQKYYLRILTLLENPNELRFAGTVKIIIEALENTRNITLHSKALNIDESRITLRQISGDGKKSNCVSSTSVNPVHDFYILNTCDELLAGNVYKLSLPFSGNLSRDLFGYYRSSYKDPETNVTHWLSATQFEPTSARKAFPCYDEPGYKASFVITLGHHKELTGLSNMPVKETRPHESLPNYIWCEFQESVPMSTYLVAYSVNDFSHKPSTLPNGAHFRTWARPNAIDQCDFAAEFGPKVLQYYEQFFGTKFPLPKIDQLAVPDFAAGAMENWGLVIYRESTLLFSPTRSSLADKQDLAEVIAHELAHQWFGNLVTMKWWTDLWLNEGFATYVAGLGVDNVHPEWQSKDRGSLSALLASFRMDALVSSHPISRPIQMATDIEESFDAISYQKGSSVLRMMHLFLGEESFRSGLKSYLELYAYKNAEQDNLWESLTQAAHQDGALPKNYEIKTIMDSWTLQTGYPMVNVSRDYAAGTARLSQERYLYNTQIPRAQRAECWWLPLSYTTQSENDFNQTMPKAWMECSRTGESIPVTIQDLPGCDQWVIFNNQLAAPFKVNYDGQNWKLLIETLNSDKFESIHVINRAQILDDVLFFAWTGEQDYETALQVTEYLERERDLLPWKSAFNNLKLLNRILRQTPSFGFFKRFIAKILTPIYNDLGGMNDTFSSIQHQDQILLKTMVVNWACQYQVEDCVPQAQTYFRRWRSEANPDENNPVPINLRAIVYCAAIRYGSDDDWDFLWSRFKNSNVGSEKQTILGTLGCSREVWILQRYLEMAFNPKGHIRRQESSLCFHAVASGQVGFLLAKKYLIDNVELIHKYYYPQTRSMSRLLSAISEQVIRRSDLNAFRAFANNSRQYLKGIQQAMKQNLEIMLTNVQWMDRNYHQVSHIIQQHV